MMIFPSCLVQAAELQPQLQHQWVAPSSPSTAPGQGSRWLPAPPLTLDQGSGCAGWLGVDPRTTRVAVDATVYVAVVDVGLWVAA